MDYVVTKKEMQVYDARTSSYFGVSSIVLMERAALAVTEGILNRFGAGGKRVLVVCGSGNNGGDGFAIARMLLLEGFFVTVYFAGKEEKMSDTCRVQRDIFLKYKERRKEDVMFVTEWQQQSYDIVIDALFGIGLSRDIDGGMAVLVRRMNDLEAFKLAVDIPSGIHADTGQVLGTAFRADVTYTFGFFKRGLLLHPGIGYAGEVLCRQIGITKESFLDEEPEAFSYTGDDLDNLPVRRPDANKGSFGKISLFAGSGEIGGAAVLAAEAAYRMGSGYVRLFTHDNNRAGVMAHVPEAVAGYYRDDTEEASFLQMCGECYRFCDVAAVGAGIGKGEKAARMLAYLIQKDEKPLVIDADGLNIIAESAELKQYLTKTAKTRRFPIIMTPHLLEFSRLCGLEIPQIKRDFPKAVTDYADKMGVILVAKDAVSLVSDRGRRLYINRSGCEAMATAGSGDVLFGMLAALVGASEDAFLSACLCVYIHGLCGERAKERTNSYFVKASDLAGQLAAILSV